MWMKQSENAKKIPKEEKSIKYWKDIIFILVLLLLLLLLLSTVSASVTQEISRHVKQRSENWFYLNNPAKPFRYIFNFH